MKNLITKKSLVIAAALSFAFMMTSCNKKTAADKSNALYTLTFARGAYGHALNPLFELGKRYYSEYGVDVKVVPLEREQIFESESIGKVDGAYNDLAFPLQFGGNGGNIVIYGGAMNGGMALLAKEQYEANFDMEYSSTILKGKELDSLKIDIDHASKYGGDDPDQGSR